VSRKEAYNEELICHNSEVRDRSKRNLKKKCSQEKNFMGEVSLKARKGFEEGGKYLAPRPKKATIPSFLRRKQRKKRRKF